MLQIIKWHGCPIKRSTNHKANTFKLQQCERKTKSGSQTLCSKAFLPYTWVKHLSTLLENLLLQDETGKLRVSPPEFRHPGFVNLTSPKSEPSLTNVCDRACTSRCLGKADDLANFCLRLLSQSLAGGKFSCTWFWVLDSRRTIKGEVLRISWTRLNGGLYRCRKS